MLYIDFKNVVEHWKHIRQRDENIWPVLTKQLPTFKQKKVFLDNFYLNNYIPMFIGFSIIPLPIYSEILKKCRKGQT